MAPAPIMVSLQRPPAVTTCGSDMHWQACESPGRRCPALGTLLFSWRMNKDVDKAVARLLKVAVVEDDDEYREAILLPSLRDAGFDVDGMGSARELYRAMVGARYDLVLLDIGLPDEDGLEIASYLRELSPTLGIVMVTGNQGPRDRVRGLAAGADAYLPKPVDIRELLETLRGLARRIGAGGVAGGAVAAGGWRLAPGGWRLVSPGGVKVTLTLPERHVVELLFAAKGAPVRREALITALAGDTGDFDPHRLEMLVHRLRRKCLERCGGPLPLSTVRGVGYALDV